MTEYRLSIPARINILGNPTDANEGDFATISAAVELRAGARAAAADEIILESLAAEPEVGAPGAVTASERFPCGVYPLPYTGGLDLLKGAINRLYQHSPEFRQKYARHGIRIATWSQVPRQSGLGGSSLFVLMMLGALRQVYDLDLRFHNEYVLSELTQRVEALELGITCGFADRYVPLFGGLGYLDYRGKLHHRPLGQEPFVTYERLDAWVEALPLVAICTGIQHDSGDVHGRMRPRYLEEQQAWEQQGGPMPPMVRWMTSAWEAAWRGKIALLQGDYAAFGSLMYENHRLVKEMMMYCGFTDGAGRANNLLIETARRTGALGAKLTGAGGGGSVFALARPEEEEKLIEVWQRTAAQNGLNEAWVYRMPIARQGLVVEAICKP